MPMTSFTFKHLGDKPMAYPGHSMIFAYLALIKYGNIEDALQMVGDYPACVGDSDLDGTGSCAWAGHHLLQQIQAGVGVEDLIDESKADWRKRVAGDGDDLYEPGRVQAEEFEERFARLVEKVRAEVLKKVED